MQRALLWGQRRVREFPRDWAGQNLDREGYWELQDVTESWSKRRSRGNEDKVKRNEVCKRALDKSHESGLLEANLKNENVSWWC